MDKNEMKLRSNVYLIILLYLRVAVATDDYCNKSYVEEFEYTSTCNTTKLTNLTRNNADQNLDLYYASDRLENDNLYEKFYLHCCFYSQPYCPTIRWYKDGTQLFAETGKRDFKEDGRTLVVYFGKKEDEGNYTCNATTAYRNEESSHTIQLKLELKCEGRLDARTSPPNNAPIKIVRGTNKTLQCMVFCFGQNQFADIYWRNGKGELLTQDNPKYIISEITETARNSPDITSELKVVNFTKNANVTCYFQSVNAGQFMVKRTFALVVTEPECDSSISPKGIQNIVAEKGSNNTLKCEIFCLGKEKRGEPIWRNGNGELITNSSLNYKVRRRKVGSRNYEIILTVMNVSRNENFSCHRSEFETTSSETSIFQLVLARTTATALQGEESFFQEKGVWIVVGSLILVLVGAVVLVVWFKEKLKTWSIFYRPNKAEERSAQYDAFVSYSEADGGSFVRSTLVPMLEEQCGYTLSLHYREFIPGAAVVDNITEFLHNSRRIIAVITPKFLDSEWCKFEVHQGLRRAVERPNTLVVIMLNEIPLMQLPNSLRTFLNKVTFLQWDGNKGEKMCENLKRALGPPLTANSSKDEDVSGKESSDGEEVMIDMALPDSGDNSCQADIETPNETTVSVEGIV